MDYEARLTALGITSLFERRKRGDLIQIFKIIKGIDIVNWHNPLQFCDGVFRNSNINMETSSANTRRHNLRYHRDIYNINYRYHFFTNRVANDWNALPSRCVSTNSVNQFKANIDDLFYAYGTYSFNSIRIARET